jgi:molybdate transport system substrate-binding protein
VLTLVSVGLLLAACGSGDASSSGSPSSDSSSPKAWTKLTVLAAASLTEVFPKIGAEFTKAHPDVTFTFSFGGTDQLAAQIQEGAPADVFAGASTRYGDQLAAAGQIKPYTVFCTNELVLIVPASNPAGITSLQDLATKDVKLVIGSETVPVGSYTRTVLGNLDSVYGSGYSDKVLANAVSNEDSVTSIVTKVESGEADAGFVYITDALAAGSKVKTLTLPATAEAVAKYPIAVVSATKNGTAAQQFADFVLTPPAQALLKQAGFGPPPST